MKIIVQYLAFMSLILLVSCDNEPDDNMGVDPMVEEEKEEEMVDPPTRDTTESGLPYVIPSGDEQYLNLDSDYIFDQDKLHTFELIIPEEQLKFLDDDPAAEEYVEGMLIFEGDTISPVGVRYKGSIGGFVGCVSGSDWANPSGHKTCTKLSMKVKINWEGRDEKFYKLKKLQLHSQNLDNSQMRDRLGYYMFNAMGVPSPRAVHARLLINGKYNGLYSNVEQIDNRLIKYHFDDDDGNLYKEAWPLGSNGEPYSEQYYINALKTNEDENPSVDFIRSFGFEVKNAGPSELKAVIEKSMDIDEVLSYCVVDRTIRHDDGPFHWYCNGNDCDNHNYYWYEEPNNKELHLIPWDLDNAFENIIFNANPVTPVADAWGEVRNNCDPFSFGNFGFRQWSAGCDKLTGGWMSYKQEYDNIKTQFVEGPFSEAHVNELLSQWHDQIKDATVEADETIGDAISISRWENALSQLRNQCDFAREN